MLQRNSALRRRAALLVGGFLAGSLMVATGVSPQAAFADGSAPVPVADVLANAPEDTAIVVKPADNDANGVGAFLSAESVAAGACGLGGFGNKGPMTISSVVQTVPAAPPATTLVISPAPCDETVVTYQPPANYSGPVTLTYSVCDVFSTFSCAVSTISYTVDAVDEAPIAVNDNAVGNEDTVIYIDVNVDSGTGNDLDPDNEPPGNLTWIIGTPPANGSVGSFFDLGDGYFDEINYTPNLNFNGSDSFTYFICDAANNCSNTATVNITVNPVNDNPNAVDDIVATTPNSSINILVLANDTDIDLSDVPPAADVLTVTGVGPVTCVCGGLAIANVAPGNLSVDFQIGPGQPNGIYSFTYSISDGQGGTDTATVFVAVAQIAPIVIDETASTEEDTPITVDVLANDLVGLSGPPGSGLLLTHITQGTYGNATANLNVVGDGEIYYIPNPQFNGHDEITYMVCNDQTNSCGVGVLQITVQSVNDVPDGRDDFAMMDEDDPALALNVLDNDTDEDWNDGSNPPGNPPPAQFIYVNRIISVTPAAAGNAEIVWYGEGTNQWPNDIEFTPAADFNTDNDPAQDVVIEYEVCDSFDYPIAPPALLIGDCDPGTGQRVGPEVRIRINPVNDQIDANNDFYSTPEDTVLNFSDITSAAPASPAGAMGPFANDTDVEDVPADYLLNSITDQPDHGTLDIGVPYYVWTYTPDAGYSGGDSFDYRVCDTDGSCDTATVFISVGSLPDAPIAIDDFYVINEDQELDLFVLANDADPDGDPITVNSVAGVPPGYSAVNLGDRIHFVPNANAAGVIQFTYDITDGTLISAPATVTILIVAANDAPVAVDDVFGTLEDTPSPANPITNDTDADGDALSLLAIASQPAHGIAQITGPNQVTYTPAPNYFGPDSYTYTVSDGNGGTDTGTVFYTVNNVDDVPTAMNDFVSTPEDTEVVIFPLTNDISPDGLPMTVVLLGPLPVGSSGFISGPNSINWTPAPNFTGIAGFTYTMTDPDGDASAATIFVNVSPGFNDIPVANDDFVGTLEDTPHSYTGPASNDTDGDGDPLTVSMITVPPTHGTALITGPNTVLYTPNPNYNGPDAYQYQIVDTNGGSDTAWVNYVVVPVDDTPTAVNDFVATPEDTQITVFPLTNDISGDGLPMTLVSLGALPGGSTGFIFGDSVKWTPAPNATGLYSFTYTMADPDGDTSMATIYVDVSPAANDIPVANNDFVGTLEDTPHVFVGPASNDTDGDGDPLTVVAITVQPTHGTALITGPNSVTYTPNANYNGPDSYQYQISDGNGGSAWAWVNYVVLPVDDSPIAIDDYVATPEDTQVTIAVMANDTSPDGPPLTLTSLGALPGGSTGYIFGNTVKWTPAPNALGVYSFTYTVTDPDGDTDTATIFIDVTPGANDAPVAVDDVAVTAEDTPHGVNPITNDTDADGDVLSLASIVTPPAHGTAQITGPNIITYTPAPNYSGPDSYEYMVVDGQGGSDVGTVFYTVSPADDAPTAVNDFVATPEDTQITIFPLTNDISPDGLPMTLVSLGALPAGSTGFIFGDSVKWTPAPNATGLYSFTYTMADPDGDTSMATIYIDVSPTANDIPVANNDFVGTLEDTPHVYTGPASNDTDGDGDTLTVVAITVAPTHGTALITGPNTVTYTPNPTYNGPDSYQYQISDGNGGSAWAWVNYVVLPVDDSPIAVDDYTTTPEDTQVTIFVLANDLSPDGPPLTLTGLGPLPVGSSGFIFGDTIKWTPAPNFTGVAGFTYTITDPDGDTDTGSVFVEVTADNQAPIANDDIAVTNEDTAVIIDILANDVEPDGEALTIFPGVAAHGLVAEAPAGFLTYTPFLNYSGPDSFTYIICDPSLACDIATVNITVFPVNDAPVGNDDVASTTVLTAINIDVLANDSDIDGGPLTVTSVSAATGGIATVAPGGLSVNYLAPAAPGIYTFTYSISDGLGGTDTGILVTVFVGLVDADAPIVLNDAWSTPEDTAVDIDVLVNDFDPTGAFGPLTINWVTQAAHGNVTVNDTVIPGMAHYIPDPQFNGHDYFSYTACNTIGQCVVGHVVVTVESVNDVPVARDDLAIINEDSPTVDIDVLENDSDEDDGDGAAPNPAQYIYVNAITIAPLFGDAVIVGTGPTSFIRYTPGPNFNGYDTFDYEICDSFDYPVTPPAGSPGDCDTATVVINVKALNDPPLIVDDQLTVPEDGISALFDPTLNDTDVEDGTPNLTQVTQPSHGSVAVLPGGLVRYFPHPNFNGSDSFTYQACDSGGLCGWGTVYVTVGPIPDAPVANNDVASTQEEAPPITIDVLANDYDMDNIPPSNAGLQVASVTQPAAGGGIAWIQNNKVMYMPDLQGIWTFTYDACDQSLLCTTATVTVYVSRKNNPPIGLNDVAATLEDTMVSIPVLANDIDPDGDPIHIGFLTVPTMGGQVVINGTNVEYTPALNFVGIDTFTYVVCDNLGACSGAILVQVTVGAVPDNPYAVDDLFITPENTPIVLTVLNNDSDGDDQDLRICAITIPPAIGIAVIQGIGANADTILYTPAHGWNGHDQLTYQVGDGPCGAASTRFDTAVVDIVVLPVNQGVTAIDDIASTPVGEAVDIDVKANDFDGDTPPDPLTVKGVSADGVTFQLQLDTASGNGRVTVNADNTIHYDPDYGFEGQDEFWYKVCDPYDFCDIAHVVVSVGHDPASSLTSISGWVYFDLNLNGTRDFGEPDVLGVKVELWAAGADGIIQTGDDFKVSEVTINGPYAFDHLPCNTTYLLKVDPSTVPPGFIYSDDPSNGLDGFGVIATGGTACGAYTNQNFGLVIGGDLPETK